MKKVLKFFLITIVVIIIAAVGAGYYFLSTFDLNKYKSDITRIVEEQIGRKLIIHGDASIGISLVPTIIIERIELENAKWAQNPVMVSIDRVEVSFAILPLLKKQIVVDKVAIDAPKAFLEISKEGKANWDFSQPNKKAEEEAAAKTSEPAKSTSTGANSLKSNPQYALLAGFVANSVSIADGYVQFDDMRSDKTTKVDIKSVNLSAKGIEHPVKLDFDVIYDAQAISGYVTAGSVNALLNEENYPVDATLKALGISLKVKGNLKNVLKDIAFALNLDVYNPSGNMNAPETTLKSKIEGNTKVINVDISSLDVAKNVITGTIKANLSGALPFVAADLQSDKIDVQTLMPAQKSAFVMPDIIASANASTLVPNEKVPYDLLKTANADVNLKIAKLIINKGMEAENVEMKALLNNGELKVAPLNLNIGGGSVNATAGVNANLKQASVKMLSKGLVLQNVVQDLRPSGSGKFAIKEGGSVDIDIDVLTTGNTYRQLVQNMNGRAVIIVGESAIQTGEVKFLQLPILEQIISTLQLGKLVKGSLDLNCAVVRADMKGGKVKFPEGIAVQATQLNLVSDGIINLMDDSIDFGLQPTAGKIDTSTIATALTSFARIRGTIENPKIALDEKQALKTAAGVALGGPIAVGGAVLISNNSAPCYTALQGTEYAERFPKPEGAVAATQDVYGDAKQVVKDTLKDAKSNLKDIKSTGKEELDNLKNAGKDLLKGFGVK